MNIYPKITLLLVRHAQARSSDGLYKNDTPLSDLGIQQAKALSSTIAGYKINSIYSSPITRSTQTADIIAKAIEIDITLSKELSEFELPQQQISSFSNRSDLLIWRPEHKGIDNGETLFEFYFRIGCFFETLMLKHINEKIIIVSHAGTIDAIFRWAIGIAPKEPITFDLEIPNASITELEIWPKGCINNGAPRYASVLRIGDIRHLPSLSSEI